MKKVKKCKVIKESDPTSFEKQYTTKVEKIKGYDANIQYSDGYFIAVITWEETVIEEEETVAEEFHREGIRYVCEQCPYLEMDGDKRKKRFPCKYAEFGGSRVDSECCEMFYKLLKQGQIVPRM